MRLARACRIDGCDSSYSKLRLVTSPATQHARQMSDDLSTNEHAVTRYSGVAILLHWAIAVLVLSTIPLGLFGANAETEAAQVATNAHKSVGILILVFTVVRLGWRVAHTPPVLPATMTPMLHRIAKATHVLFYLLLIVLPLSGWWMSSAVPQRHPFGFGLFDVPFLPVPRGFASAGPAHFVHVNLGFLMIGLALLHIAAALKHHFFDRDGILTRMLPRSA